MNINQALETIQLTGSHTVGQFLTVNQKGEPHGFGPICLLCGNRISLPYGKESHGSFPCPECGKVINWGERYRPLIVIFDDGQSYFLPPEIEKISHQISDWRFLREQVKF